MAAEKFVSYEDMQFAEEVEGDDVEDCCDYMERIMSPGDPDNPHEDLEPGHVLCPYCGDEWVEDLVEIAPRPCGKCLEAWYLYDTEGKNFDGTPHVG